MRNVPAVVEDERLARATDVGGDGVNLFERSEVIASPLDHEHGTADRAQPRPDVPVPVLRPQPVLGPSKDRVLDVVAVLRAQPRPEVAVEEPVAGAGDPLEAGLLQHDVRGLRDDAPHAVRNGGGVHQRNRRAVAVAEEHGPRDASRLEQRRQHDSGLRFEEVHRPRPRPRVGAAITPAAVGKEAAAGQR